MPPRSSGAALHGVQSLLAHFGAPDATGKGRNHGLGSSPVAGRPGRAGTGASRGIGRAIARRFASAGATVIVNARSLDGGSATGCGEESLQGTLRETVELIEGDGGRAMAIAADLEAPRDRDRLIEQPAELAGGVDILVNNAGSTRFEPVESIPRDCFERTVDHYFRIRFPVSGRYLWHEGEETGLDYQRGFRSGVATAGAQQSCPCVAGRMTNWAGTRAGGQWLLQEISCQVNKVGS